MYMSVFRRAADKNDRTILVLKIERYRYQLFRKPVRNISLCFYQIRQQSYHIKQRAGNRTYTDQRIGKEADEWQHWLKAMIGAMKKGRDRIVIYH